MPPFTPKHLLFEIIGYKIGVEPLFYFIGLSTFIYLLYKGLQKEGIKGKEFLKFITILLLSIYFGGKIWKEISQWKGLISLVNIINPLHHNITSFGMFLGLFAGVIIYLMPKKSDFAITFLKKKNFWNRYFKTMDKVAIPSALLIFIIRLGCFIDGHVIGKVSSVAWCVFKEGACRHPIALYLSLNGLLTFMLLILFFSGKKHHGQVISFFLLIYSFNRFFIEFLRDIPTVWLSFTRAHFGILFLFLFSLLIYFLTYKNAKK